jgi:hypothetical protein
MMERFNYYDHYYPDGHCMKCNAMVGLGGPNRDQTYEYAYLHLEWHNHHKHFGESSN